jgi:hypothetical protein
MPRAAIFLPQRRSMVSPGPMMTGPGWQQPLDDQGQQLGPCPGAGDGRHPHLRQAHRERRAAHHGFPRVRDLRHRCAIRTLLDWYRDGKNIEQQLPVLSTYLGYAYVRDTYLYFSACPELMQEAARRLDRRWEAKP